MDVIVLEDAADHGDAKDQTLEMIPLQTIVTELNLMSNPRKKAKLIPTRRWINRELQYLYEKGIPHRDFENTRRIRLELIDSRGMVL
ncbi:hypothetical protein PT974_03154 [Cladobotryum mycophilum]|uniref:Uncharacterized protein n=1 Tax=Cladobotryum mycophilum TaxID=491253 RepID=A0ABR0SSM5_9HYPO